MIKGSRIGPDNARSERTMELSEMREQVADFENRTEKLGRRL
jgi:hypothetical protein